MLLEVKEIVEQYQNSINLFKNICHYFSQHVLVEEKLYDNQNNAYVKFNWL